MTPIAFDATIDSTVTTIELAGLLSRHCAHASILMSNPEPCPLPARTTKEFRDQARQETDADAQAEIWKQANIEILQNYAAFGIMYINQVYARQNTVDYGHELTALISLYPGITENTTVNDSGA